MPNFPKYESYKDSGVEWLGEIPSHWGTVKLRYISSIINGSTPSSSVSEYWDGDIVWITPNDLGKLSNKYIANSERKITTKGLDSCGTQLSPKGSIILSTRAPIGHAAITTVSSCINQGCKVIIPTSSDVYSDYIYYLIMVSKEYLNSFGKGTTFRELSATELKSYEITQPPLEEQKRIVEFLDRTTAEIDRAIGQKQRLIELLQEQKAILINQAVTKGLNPNVPMRDSAIEWIGEIPEHWRTIAIKRASKNGYKTFIDGDWIESPYITDDGVRLIQTGNVGIGEYREKGFRYISEYTFQAFNCTQVFPNDVLICRLDGPVGRACLAPDLGVKMITSVDNAILKPSKDFDPRFIVYLMSSDSWLDWIKALCRVGGGFRFRISRSMLGDLKIAFPPLHEQKEIADRLDDALHEISVLINKFLESIDKLSEYRQITISQAVTGKIKV